MKLISGTTSRVGETFVLLGLSLGETPEGLPYISGNPGGSGGGSGSSPSGSDLTFYVTAGGVLKEVNDTVEIPIDDNYTIVEAEIIGDVSGSAVVDVKRATDAGFATFNSIAASAKPTLSGQRRVKDTTLTGWTTTLAPGDTLQFVLDSMSTITEVTIALKLEATATVSFSVPRIMTIVRTLSVSGQVIDIPMDNDALILEAEIQSDVNSSAAVAVSRATDAGFGTFNRIDNNTDTELSSSRRLVDTTLTSWNVNLSAGDTLRYTLSDLDVANRVTFALKLQIGTVVGSGGFGGSPSVGAIPKVVGAQTLGNSSLDDSGTYLVGSKVFETPAILPTSITTKTASHSLVLADTGVWIRMNVASANDVTVPPHSSIAFAVGTEITIEQLGAGQTTIVAGGGVTINTPETLKLAKQYAVASLKQVAEDEWTLLGYLEPA